MANPADRPTAVTDLRSPPPSRARRRLVQSTLIPHTPLDDTSAAAQDCQKMTTQRKLKAATTTQPKSGASNKVFVSVSLLNF